MILHSTSSIGVSKAKLQRTGASTAVHRFHTIATNQMSMNDDQTTEGKGSYAIPYHSQTALYDTGFAIQYTLYYPASRVQPNETGQQVSTMIVAMHEDTPVLQKPASVCFIAHPDRLALGSRYPMLSLEQFSKLQRQHAPVDLSTGVRCVEG